LAGENHLIAPPQDYHFVLSVSTQKLSAFALNMLKRHVASHSGKRHRRAAMSESKILDHITELVDEEQRIYAEATVERNKARLKHIAEQLDQCWDLLRQRRARLEFNEDPAAASMRDVKTVEGYTG
jgi:DNA-binding transcriptional regulator PaaX